jgi:hypothetical protein
MCPLGYGEIHTFFHAGGMTSDSIRAKYLWIVAADAAKPEPVDGALAQPHATRPSPTGDSWVIIGTGVPGGGVCLTGCDKARPTRRDQSPSRKAT